jgi:hypothetical protein
MPNVSWQEPIVLMDVLAMSLYADASGKRLGGPKELTIVSPWLSDVDLAATAGTWWDPRSVSSDNWPVRITLSRCLQAFLCREWRVSIAVLQYGSSACGIVKERVRFVTEWEFLRRMSQSGAQIYLVPNLHAKGLVTPLAVLTGSTNFTRSGLYLQSQNANYFAWNHVEFEPNRRQLLSSFQHLCPITEWK